MYCPSCGGEYTIELKYCNRCGANLGAGIEPQYEIVPVNVTKPALIIGAVMTILTVLGFGLVITGAVELSHTPNIDPDSVSAVVVVGMLTILTIDIFLALQLSKLINASLGGAKAKPKRAKMLPNPTMMPMPQPPTSRLQAVPSVTEGTTRFFEAPRMTAEAEDRATAEKLDR